VRFVQGSDPRCPLPSAKMTVNGYAAGITRQRFYGERYLTQRMLWLFRSIALFWSPLSLCWIYNTCCYLLNSRQVSPAAGRAFSSALSDYTPATPKEHQSNLIPLGAWCSGREGSSPRAKLPDIMRIMAQHHDRYIPWPTLPNLIP